jgi:uncharacterized protein (DUF58 family)
MPTAPAPDTLSTDSLAAVRHIELTARRLVGDLFAGRYHSVFKGRGLEFSEVRAYEPGDDARDIDWNVTARRGHPYIKRYVEERELTVLFLVDTSASQLFGSRLRTKARLAAELAAVLAMAALQNGDKAGLMLFTDRVERHIPPRKSRAHLLRLVREVLTFKPLGRGTDIGAALEELGRVQRKRAVVFLISDFLDDDFDRPLRVAARRHDLTAVGIRDPWEENFSPNARILLEDAESAATASWAPGPASPGRWDALSRRFGAAGVDTLLLDTDKPIAGPLLSFFQTRRKRYAR